VTPAGLGYLTAAEYRAAALELNRARNAAWSVSFRWDHYRPAGSLCQNDRRAARAGGPPVPAWW